MSKLVGTRTKVQTYQIREHFKQKSQMHANWKAQIQGQQVIIFNFWHQDFSI